MRAPDRERRLRIAFLGPEGTFSEEALFTSREPASTEPVPQPTVYDCVMAVQRGEADAGLVPIENSIEGSVGATLDALAFEADEVTISGELVHPIRHCLIAREPLALERIERVVSHPQASAQCSAFIRERLPQATVASAASTAEAVRLVAGADRPWAALGTRLAAKLYGCTVLEAGVEDTAENETRFVWLERKEAARGHRPVEDQTPAPRFKTSIVFWGLPDAPGALVQILQAFAERSINLTKIESRPRKQGGLGRYVFFADLEGHERDAAVAAALETVRGEVEMLRVLGCYPAV